MPEYIFRYPSSLDHYTADAFIVWCFDARFRKAQMAFLEHMGAKYPDLESPAGGAKIFFDPEEESDREFFSRELEKSIALHGTKEVWLFTHHDCGACGGMRRFGNDRDTEFEYHTKGYRMAREFIEKRFAHIKKVRTFFVDEVGITETTDL